MKTTYPAHHPGFMFLIRWIGLICSAFAHGPFVSRLDSYLGAETMVVGQEYNGWWLMVDMVVDTFFTFLSEPWSFEFRSERTRPTLALPSFVYVPAHMCRGFPAIHVVAGDSRSFGARSFGAPLDVYCAAGAFSKAASPLGWNYWGSCSGQGKCIGKHMAQ